MKITPQRTALAVGIVIALGGGAYVLNSQCAQVKKGAAYSSVVSLWHELTHGDALNAAKIPVGRQWRVLSSTEYESVVVELDKRHLLDKGMGNLDAGKILRDPWGAPYRIAVKSDSPSTNEVVVWSVGRDAELGTPDDVCYPADGLHQLPQGVVTRDK
jgi:hypothetical protein